MNDTIHILGIETSCDETSAAIVTGDGEILSNLVLSQLEEHRAFGGVVPEIAARAHLDHLDTLIKGALHDSGLKFFDLTAVAATSGPGLIGGVMVGMVAGKAIAATQDIPFLGINHLEGHALTPRLTDPDIHFPYLLLLISGGHTQILVVEGAGKYKRWGTTLDDAAGECFDKSAKIMGLPYPGGPQVQKIAAECRAQSRQETLPAPQAVERTRGLRFLLFRPKNRRAQPCRTTARRRFKTGRHNRSRLYVPKHNGRNIKRPLQQRYQTFQRHVRR